MKREISMIVLSIVVIFGIVLWFSSVSRPIGIGDIILYGCISILVIFALVVAFNRIKAIKAGLPAEDELSTKIKQKAAAWSYYVSLYWWLVIMYFSDKFKLEMNALIGVGLIGMAVLFGIFWAYFNFKGKFNE